MSNAIYSHFALNLDTQELISCTSANALKHSVALNNRYGFGGRWVFAHGVGAERKLLQKAIKRGVL